MISTRATMESYYPSGDASDVYDCEIRISDGKITVSYDKIVYQGHEVTAGHFKLTCPELRGRATLHRFENNDVLEGYWVQSGFEGMWRIEMCVDDE